MGIYTNGKIYGIRIYNYVDDIANTLYQHIIDNNGLVTMTRAQMREAYLFYTENQDKTDIHFEFYTECSSTLNSSVSEEFMIWHPLTLESFIWIFGQP